MVNIEFGKDVEGRKLADTVEAAMNSLNGFEVEKQSHQRYDSSNKLFEFSRSLKARKKFRFYDPFIIAFQHPNLNPIGGFGFLIPIYGWAGYWALLTDKSDGRCVLGANIILDKKYTSLDFIVAGRHRINLNPENEEYSYVKGDVEKFVYYLNQQLRI